jgi:hypothetical protein
MSSVFDSVSAFLETLAFYDHERFAEWGDLPNESTLEVNVTHEQLTALAQNGEDVVALSPTRYAEGTGTDPTAPFGEGYDIRFNTAREIVFQHKAPAKTVVRGEDNRNKRQWLQFNLDLMQIVNLAIQYEPRQAFLALPVVPTKRQLGNALALTVFVDVWEIFARLHQLGLKTDYILVECLLNQNPLGRYPFDTDGELDLNEYYAKQPLIRGKYAGSEWGMYRTEPDPYYDIAYGNSMFTAAVNWNPLLTAFNSDDGGLPIRRVTRTDGGDPPRDDWFDLEVGEQYTVDYQAHLQRKYALHRYAQDSDEILTGQIEDWLLTDLDRRFEQAREDQRLAGIATDERHFPDTVSDQRTSVDKYIQRFQQTQDPIQYHLHRTSRFIQQTGEEAETVLTI